MPFCHLLDLSVFNKEGRFWKLDLHKRAFEDNESQKENVINDDLSIQIAFHTRLPVSFVSTRPLHFNFYICDCADFKGLPGSAEFENKFP